MAEETPVDILDQVKKIDKAIKAKLLIEKIAQLKTYAREVNELREKSVATLEELDLSPKDIKRIIDYINELPEVKLSERDKEEIRSDINEVMTEEKQETEKTFREVDLEKFMKTVYHPTTTASGPWYTTTAGHAGPLSISGNGFASGTGLATGNAMYMSNVSGASYMATIDNGHGESISVKL